MSAIRRPRRTDPPAVDAPPDLPRCRVCSYPMARARRPAPEGYRRRCGRGLCTCCHGRLLRAGELDDYDRVNRTRDEVLAEVEWLRTAGVHSSADLAERLGMSVYALEQHIYRARREQDPRVPVTSSNGS